MIKSDFNIIKFECFIGITYSFVLVYQNITFAMQTVTFVLSQHSNDILYPTICFVISNNTFCDIKNSNLILKSWLFRDITK